VLGLVEEERRTTRLEVLQHLHGTTLEEQHRIPETIITQITTHNGENVPMKGMSVITMMSRTTLTTEIEKWR
jgi:hypothetical protein